MDRPVRSAKCSAADRKTSREPKRNQNTDLRETETTSITDPNSYFCGSPPPYEYVEEKIAEKNSKTDVARLTSDPVSA
jgi:hypothetical protein